jgi:hypothetical protein
MWTLCVYCVIGCPDELKDFLARHPEKVKLMGFVMPALWKMRLMKAFQKLFQPFKPQGRILT